MTGVFKDNIHGGWIANYGKHYKKHFVHKNDAIQQRKAWESIFGIPKCGKRRNVNGLVFGNITVIHDTGENIGKDQMVLARNNITGVVKEHSLGSLVSGSTNGSNGWNQPQKNNSSGFTGVSKHKDKWRAQITINKNHYYLGDYILKEEAHKKYKEAVDNIKKGILPNSRPHYLSNSRIKGIFITPYGTYRVSKDINGKRYRKTFTQLKDAKKYMSKLLKEHGLTE